MPIHSCTLSGGGSGYKYGESGHCYASREKALTQMRAMFYNGYTGAEKIENVIEDVIATINDDEFTDILNDTQIPFSIRAEFSHAKVKKDKRDKIPKDKNGESQLPNVIVPLG